MAWREGVYKKSSVNTSLRSQGVLPKSSCGRSGALEKEHGRSPASCVVNNEITHCSTTGTERTVEIQWISFQPIALGTGQDVSMSY